MNLYLTGYRGTGKTTIGKQLAKELNWSWIDVDQWIESNESRKISDIFQCDGEAHFRQIEEQTLEEIVQRDRHVVSLGGGAVLSALTRQRLSSTGRCYWLQANVETLASRIDQDQSAGNERPRLTASNELVDEIRLVMEERKPLYEEVADLAISTETNSVSEVVTKILADFRA